MMYIDADCFMLFTSLILDFPWQFGDSQKLRLVRILRSTVMVRVGGGWEPLEEFLQKHDPCRGESVLQSFAFSSYVTIVYFNH